MTERGKLEEANRADPPASGGVYEYRRNPATDSIKKQIEERERQLNEEKQRLKEIESRSSTLIRIEKKRREKGTAQLQWPMSAFII